MADTDELKYLSFLYEQEIVKSQVIRELVEL